MEERKAEVTFRDFEVATQTLSPQLAALEEKLKKGDTTVLENAVGLVPKFLDQLRPGTAGGFEACCGKPCKKK